MANHEYTVWVNYGVTVVVDCELDTDYVDDNNFHKIRNAVADKLIERGIHEVIADADFSEIIYNGEAD